MAVAAADFNCEDGLAQQPIGKSELSRRKLMVGSFIAVLGGAMMLGFFVLGPLAKAAMTDAEATQVGHGQKLAKFTYAMPGSARIGSLPVGSNIQRIAASAASRAPPTFQNPVVQEASRLYSQCRHPVVQGASRNPAPQMSIPLGLDLKGKVAFVAGVADSTGFGWAICKALAEAGATITVGTWPPVLGIFEKNLAKGAYDEDMILSDGSKMVISKVYPLDATFDTPADVPEHVLENKRYKGLEGYTISECASKVGADYNKIDILVHSLANGPEVTKPLMQTSRSGYLAASSASSYSLVSLVQNFAPKMNPGGSVLSLTYIASEKVIPGYGGGMSSAKAQLESDTRVLAYEAGQSHQIRVNTISAGPLKSRAAMAISDKNGPKSFIEVAIDYCHQNAPLERDLISDDVGQAAAFLCSPMASAVTGSTLYVDNGMHSMGMVQNVAIEQVRE